MSAPPYCLLGVDDSMDDLILLRRALRKTSGLDLATTLGDGLQAIAYLNGDGPFADRTQWPLPDLLVLDLKMPNLDGFGVLDWLARQPAKHCKVVMLTSSLADVDRAKALRLGADAVCVKPVDPAGYRALAQLLASQVNRS